MHNKLERMKETLMSAVEVQMCNLEEADTKELGEVIDMIKDLEEAIYYCTVTEAMKSPSSEMEFEMKKDNNQKMYYMGYPMYNDMHYDERRRREDGTFYSSNSNGTSYSNGNRGSSSSNGTSYSDSMMYRDSREGRSYNSRRSYLEAKEYNRDKNIQLKELEKYMQELSQDMTEMISDATSEEKQYLEKKISALATKIGQMK